MPHIESFSTFLYLRSVSTLLLYKRQDNTGYLFTFITRCEEMNNVVIGLHLVV